MGFFWGKKADFGAGLGIKGGFFLGDSTGGFDQSQPSPHTPWEIRIGVLGMGNIPQKMAQKMSKNIQKNVKKYPKNIQKKNPKNSPKIAQEKSKNIP